MLVFILSIMRLCSVFLTCFTITFSDNAELIQSHWQFNLTCWLTTVHGIQLNQDNMKSYDQIHTIHLIFKYKI